MEKINFYPRSPCGERHAFLGVLSRAHKFLSTLSLRRATVAKSYLLSVVAYFYPRSPCGERQSIFKNSILSSLFLSTLSLRRATSLTTYFDTSSMISIHALLAESDSHGNNRNFHHSDFYPRSPCGERLVVGDVMGKGLAISIHALLAESDRLHSLLV